MARPSKPRLGRGISALIGDPVRVNPDDSNKIQTSTPASATQAPSTPPERAGRSEDVVARVAVGELRPNRHQPRSPIEDESLRDLAASIRSAGVMQPIIARRIGNSLEIVVGERRWRAARLAGLDAVPVIIREIDDLAAAQWAIIENVQREDLNPIDRGMAFRNLVEKFGFTQTMVAEAVSLDRSSVANLIRLTDLEPQIRQMISSGALGAGHGKALLAVESGATRLRLAQRAVDERWTVRDIEKRAGDNSRTPPKRGERSNQADVAAIEKQLGEHLGTKVQVRSAANRKRGKIVIDFYGIDHFDGLMSRMGVRLDS